MRYKLVRLWSNFAKYRSVNSFSSSIWYVGNIIEFCSNPTPKKEDLLDNQIWMPINPQKPDVGYMNIGSKLTSRVNPHHEDVRFWDYLFEKYGNPPFDVY